MDEMESKLGAILNNPQMMQQIMALAQSMNNNSEAEPKPDRQKKQDTASNPIPDIDLGMLQKLSGFAGQSSIDRDQQALLNALGPYLSRERVSKLERAMRAAKMARVASSLFGSGILHF